MSENPNTKNQRDKTLFELINDLRKWESLSKIFGSINDSRMYDFYTFM